MKATKKLLATILSLAMLASLAVTALADESTNDTGTGTVVAPGEIPDYVEIDTVYKFILPTSSALNFTLDPQGLSALAEGESMSVAELLASGAAGAVLFNDYTPTIISESTVPVELTLTPGVTGNVGTTGTDVKVVAKGAVSDGGSNEDNNLFIGMSASAESVSEPLTTKDTFAGYMQTALTDTPLPSVFVTDEAEAMIWLREGKYSFEVTPGTGNGTQLLFEGLCNPYADWSEYYETAAVKAVYTYTGAGTAVAVLTDGNVGETVIVNGTTATFQTTANVSEGEFSDLDELIAVLNADETNGYTYASANADADIVATAKVAGEAGESGPAAAVAISGTASITTNPDETTPGREASSDPEKEVGMTLAYAWEPASETTGAYATFTGGVYGLAATGTALPSSTATWADAYSGVSGLATARSGLAGGIGPLEDAIEVYALIDEPNATEITTAKTAFNAAKGLYTAAWTIADANDVDSYTIKKLNDMYSTLQAMFNALGEAASAATAIEMPDAPPSVGKLGFAGVIMAPFGSAAPVTVTFNYGDFTISNVWLHTVPNGEGTGAQRQLMTPTDGTFSYEDNTFTLYRVPAAKVNATLIAGTYSVEVLLSNAETYITNIIVS